MSVRTNVSSPFTTNASPITPTKASSSLNPLRLVTTKPRTPTLPSYHSLSPAADTKPAVTISISPTSRYSRATACTKKKIFGPFAGLGRRESNVPPMPTQPVMQISAPMGVNPQFAHLIKPNGQVQQDQSQMQEQQGRELYGEVVRRPDSALHPARGGGSGEVYRF